jgi:uncharacterized protein
MKNIVRIGVLSDTHLHEVTQEFLGIYERYLSRVDLILHAGDVVSPELIDFLSASATGFYGVCGNMDPTALRQMLPDKKVVTVAGYRIGLIHGWGQADDLEDRIIPLFHQVDIIVYGHSHIPSNHVRDRILLFNPGTATGYSASGKHSIGILELGETAQGTIVDF